MSRHIQPRIKGVKRRPRYTSLLPVLDAWIQGEARRFNVCPSFVLATLVQFVSGKAVDAQPDYQTFAKPRRTKTMIKSSRVIRFRKAG